MGDVSLGIDPDDRPLISVELVQVETVLISEVLPCSSAVISACCSSELIVLAGKSS